MQQAKQNFPIFPLFSTSVRKAVSGGVQLSKGCICHKPTSRPREVPTPHVYPDPPAGVGNNLRVLTTRYSTATKGASPNPQNYAHQRKSRDHRSDQTKVIGGRGNNKTLICGPHQGEGNPKWLGLGIKYSEAFTECHKSRGEQEIFCTAKDRMFTTHIAPKDAPVKSAQGDQEAKSDESMVMYLYLYYIL